MYKKKIQVFPLYGVLGVVPDLGEGIQWLQTPVGCMDELIWLIGANYVIILW